MNKFLGNDIKDPVARVQFLKDNCDKVERIDYMHRFTQEELDEMKGNLSDTDININDVEIEKKELVKELSDKLKPMKKTRVSLLDKIKKKAELVNEECFKFIDHENKSANFYNSEGELVYSRPIYAEEAQTSIFNMPVKKTGTDN